LEEQIKSEKEEISKLTSSGSGKRSSDTEKEEDELKTKIK
jgi:structural maintenance of chromosome 1